MRDTLKHRGPDDAGTYLSSGVALGHRRLSILDLTPEGRQPMANEDGSVQLVFNGEIYNFAEHRLWLQERGHWFRSRTDTEVILHLYEELGVGCLAKLKGMFAFAIWDQRRRALFLARDRLGKKPLFYRFDGKRFVFGSEPKAILACSGITGEVDLSAINHYVAFGYVPSPMSAFRGIQKLAPGHYLVFANGKIEVRRYWHLYYLPKLIISEQEACEEIIRRLKQVVKLRMIADVPLGAFLSGGIDSSAIVAMMSELSSKPVKTFSIGFREPAYDETPYARIVAKQFGTEHHEFQVEPNALAIIDRLVWHYGEPYADSSALPTYYLSKIAREYVTVALNGDAGDENFGGYRRYSVNWFASQLSYAPAWLRKLTGRVISRVYQTVGSSQRSADRLRILGEVLSNDWRMGYARMAMQFDLAHRTLLYSPEFLSTNRDALPEDLILHLYQQSATRNVVDSTLFVDANLYLPDDLLVKVDIASMAVSLEARSPMVDHEFMEFVARLPVRFKMSGTKRKIILKKALARILPIEVLTRPKKGFGVPLDHWFRGEMNDFIRDIVLSPRSLQRGYFDATYVRRLVEEHCCGVRSWHEQMWNLLMLELWHREFIDDNQATLGLSSVDVLATS